MGLILTVLGAVLLCLPALVLGLLCIPWVVSLVATAGPEWRFGLEARPFSTGFPWPLRVGGAGRSGAAAPAASDAAEAMAKPATGRHEKHGPSIARDARMLRAAPRLLTGMLAAFRVEFLRLRGRIGLSDPADTGQLFGVLLALSHMRATPRVAIDLAPDFTGPALEGVAEAGVRVVPARLLPPAVRFGWQVFVRPRWNG